MDWHALFFPNITLLIDWSTQYVHNATQRLLAHRYGNGLAGIRDFQTSA